MACNLCGGEEFQAYRGRENEQCTTCGAKARHRIGWLVYERALLPLLQDEPLARVLHLAPEAALHDRLSTTIGAGYLTADMVPERYPHAKCLRLKFPDDFYLFPDGYFTAILHNHVLEHIPGHYGDHLHQFTRMLAPGGRMIFSIPGPYLDRQTEEGGEHLASDAEREEKFRQSDHFKMIGADLLDTLDALPNGSRLSDDITEEDREKLHVRPKKAPFFIWQRDS